MFFDDNFIILYGLINTVKFNIDGNDHLLDDCKVFDLPKQISYYDYNDNLVNITHMLKLKNELYKYEIRKLN